tara:strand:- start:46 stop:429 length:384 start_codon:yes stop_codon:yes gene_type:complete
MEEQINTFRPDQAPVIAAALRPSMNAITRHHYENLAAGKEVRHKDGKVSTVYTIQVEIDGKPTLIPTVWDGKIIDDEKEATRRAIASGKKWPQRKTHAELRQFDQEIHRGMKDISAKEAQAVLSGNK